MSTPTSRDVAITAARAAADKQAADIVVLDVSTTLVITDHFVICSAGSRPSGEERARGHRGRRP